MLLLYLDESARKSSHYYMGALLVDAHMTRAVTEALDGIGQFVARQVRGFDPRTEFHAYDVFQGKNVWQSVPVDLRVRVCQMSLRDIAATGARFVVRGINVHALQRRYKNPHDSHQLALCQALESVQDVTGRDGQADQDVLAIADEHHAATDSRTRFAAMKEAAEKGYTKKPLTQFLDTIYFGPSHHSRLLQAADMATFFTNRIRHVIETDERARAAMRRIEKELDYMTSYSYEWP